MTERCNERFFQMPVGQWCGFLIREDAAKKLQKILWKQTQEIKDFLTRNMDALEAENWTLAYTPEQTTVHYYDGKSKEDLKDRIALLDKADRLSFEPDVFRTDKASVEAMEEVKAFCTEHYAADPAAAALQEKLAKESIGIGRLEPLEDSEAMPLTLEELKQMNGKPVWIVEYPDWGHWELSEDAEDYLDDRDPDFYGMTMPEDPNGKYGLHALGWLAYRKEPTIKED